MNLQKASFFSLMILAVLAAGTARAVSEEEEIKRGAEEHRKVVAQFGIYRDKDLQDYVTRIGERIAKQSSRPELEFHFTVLNDEMVNAFALPGGYIYVTRGILMHMNSESELAAVLGHEIAHVTEKHGLRSESRAKLMEGLSAVAAILTQTPGVFELGDLFGGVLLRGYSREFELEADRVGAQYMAKAGYSPEAMLKTIEILKSKDRIEIEQARLEKREPTVYHGFLSTHPDNDTRYREVIKESDKLLQGEHEFVKYDEFLEKLNGLSYGDAKQTGVVRKNVFYHPKLGIRLNFPQGWRIETTPTGVSAVSQIADAMITISTARISRDDQPKAFTSKELQMNVREGREITIAGLPAFLGIADRGDSIYGPRPVRFAVIFDTRRRIAYILSGAGQYDLRNIAADKEFIATIFSFDLMDKEDQKEARQPKIQIVRAETDTTMEALAEQSPITNYALDKLRVMNGLYPNGEPEAGQLIKIVD